MRASFLSGQTVLAVFAVLGSLFSSGRAVASEGKPAARLGVIHYSPPAGWALSEETGKLAQLWACPSVQKDEPVAVLVLLTGPLGTSLDFHDRFEKAVRRAAGNQKLLSGGAVIGGRTGQGFETLSQEFSFMNGSGQTVRGKFIAARLVDRLAVFCYFATGSTNYPAHLAEMDSVVASASFDVTPPSAPGASATTAASAPYDPVAATTRPVTPAAGALLLNDAGSDKSALSAHFPPRSRLVLTLTPAAGSSAGETRTLSCALTALKNSAHFDWLPPSVCKVTAHAVTPDDREWPLKVSDKPSPGAADWADSIDADLRTSPALRVTDVPK